MAHDPSRTTPLAPARTPARTQARRCTHGSYHAGQRLLAGGRRLRQSRLGPGRRSAFARQRDRPRQHRRRGCKPHRVPAAARERHEFHRRGSLILRGAAAAHFCCPSLCSSRLPPCEPAAAKAHRARRRAWQAGAVDSLQRVRSANHPSSPTQALYVSGRVVPAGGVQSYFVAKLDRNFVRGAATSLATVATVRADSQGLANTQPWDVTAAGDVVAARSASNGASSWSELVQVCAPPLPAASCRSPPSALAPRCRHRCRRLLVPSSARRSSFRLW